MLYPDGAAQYSAMQSFNPFRKKDRPASYKNFLLRINSSRPSLRSLLNEAAICLLFCKKMKCSISIREHTALLTENSFTLFHLHPDQEVHFSLEEFEVLAITFPVDEIADFLEAYPFLNKLKDESKLESRIATAGLIKSFLEIDRLPGNEEQRSQIFFDFKSRELLMHCADYITAPARIQTSILKTDSDYQLIFRIKRFIDENLDKKHSLTELSRLFAINKDKLTKGFRQVYGKSIMDYFHFAQMEYAAELLLTTDRSVAEISAMFNLFQTNFIRLFKKIHGISPSSYRTMYKK